MTDTRCYFALCKLKHYVSDIQKLEPETTMAPDILFLMHVKNNYCLSVI